MPKPTPIEFTKYWGYCVKLSKGVLPLGFSSDLHDIDLSQPGVARTRSGCVKFTPSPLGYNATRIFNYYVPSTQRNIFIGSGGTKVFTLDASGAKTEIGSGFTSGLVFDFLNYKQTCFMANGGSDTGDLPKCYHDPDAVFRNWGIVAPTAAPVAAAGSGGGLTGAYTYAVSFYNPTSGHESTVTPYSNTVTLAGQKGAISNIPVSTDTQVTQRRIYRSTNGGAILFYLDTITDNVATTYTDNTGDASLGTTEAPLYNDPPPATTKFIEEWDGRIWAAPQFSTVISFSNDEFLTEAGAGVPEESFGPDNTIDVNAEIYGFKKAPNFDSLWIHTSKGVVAIRKTGDPQDPYTPTTLVSGNYAAISHYSISNIDNEQWYVDGAMKVRTLDSSGYTKYLSNLIEYALAGGAGFSGANFTLLRNIQAVNYTTNGKNQYRFILPESGRTTPNKMYAANYYHVTPPVEDVVNFMNVRQYPVWEVHNITATCLGIVKDTAGVDTLYTGSSDQYIKQQDTGTNDDSVAIDWSFSVGWQRMGQTPDVTAFPRWFKAYFVPFGNYNISLRTEFDLGTKGGQVYSINMAQVGDLLDSTFILDTSILGVSGNLISRTNDIAGDANYILLTLFGNALDQIMEVHNMLLLENIADGFRR